MTAAIYIAFGFLVCALPIGFTIGHFLDRRERAAYRAAMAQVARIEAMFQD